MVMEQLRSAGNLGGHPVGRGVDVPVGLSQQESTEFASIAASVRAEWAPVDDSDSDEFWAPWAEVEELLAQQAPAAFPAEELSSGLGSAQQGLQRAGEAVDEVVRVFDAGVSEALEAVGELRTHLDGISFALAREASSRGLHVAVGMGLVDWLRVRCPWLSRPEAAQLQDLVRAGEQHWGATLVAAVCAGDTPVHRGAKVARTITRLSRSLEPDQQQAFAEIAADAAGNPEISDADLNRVCKKLLIDVLDEKPKDEIAQTAQQQRCVERRPLGEGMTRFTIDAPESDAALLDGVLMGALAAPVPNEDGLPDDRSACQRHYDALLMVLNRGLSNPGAPPSSARASVLLTVQADPETGEPTGAASTHTGQVFTASEAGRFACIGDLTPIVLGEHGEPLKLGRTVRLATPGQFKALMVRDGQCTYPGCSVPGTWCDSHHLVWWCRGGDTDIEMLALLCPRHHTLVHERDLMATVAGSVVTWHV